MRGLSGDSPLKTMAKSALAGALLLALAGCASPGPRLEPAGYRGPFDAGLMAEPANRESSGLAASFRAPALLWTHSDSGGEPVIYALDHSGQARGAVRLTGVTNRDWEDLASFVQDGRAWLCVGDVGDNAGARPHIRLHFLLEPDPAALNPAGELAVAPDYSLEVIYEDGPRDCEALAVDGREGAIYLLSKREAVPRLYRVPLAPADGPVVARFVGEVPHLPQPNAAQRTLKIPTGLYRGSPCGMDFAPDGSAAVIVTYGDVLLFPRAADETWAQALARPPRRLPPHRFLQAEAVCFAADGRTVFVSSEMTAKLRRYDRRR